jgi:hypothetical protein
MSSVLIQENVMDANANANGQQHSVQEQSADKGVLQCLPNGEQDSAGSSEGTKTMSGDASIQSPASTLANTLSLLSLSTPAAVEYKGSRLAQNGRSEAEKESQEASEEAETQDKKEPDCSFAAVKEVSKQPLQRPEKAEEGDLSVGLVYDAIMEEHKSPPGVTAQTFSQIPAVLGRSRDTA